MLKRTVIGLLLGVLWPAASAMGQAYRVGVDPRVELMSILFRLAGGNEYTQGRVPKYTDAIDRYFAPYRNHPAVQLARELRTNDGVSFDAPMNMAVHIKDAESLAERVPFDRPSVRLDSRWHGVKARSFLEAARRFVVDTRFAEFLKSQKPLYDVTDNRLQAFVEKSADLRWFSRFFGTTSPVRFIVVPGLVNGGPSYGASFVGEDGVEEMYAIPGVTQVDADGDPVFTSSDFPTTMVHEFVHSHTNPLIDKYQAQLQEAGVRINEPVKEAMRAQGYGDAKTLLYESMVRASTIRYIFDHEGPGAAREAIVSESLRSFWWVGDLSDLLGTYEKDRDTYPTLESFMPRVVQFFNGIAPRMDELRRRYEESRPKILAMSIPDGALNVDPSLTEFVIRFDRPMRTTSPAVRDPRFGRVRFNEAGTSVTMTVALEPDHDYQLRLSWPGGDAFTSADGVPMQAVTVRFRTRSSPPSRQ